MIVTGLLYSFIVFTGIQILYYLVFSSFLFHTKKNNKKSPVLPISIIICAKNEAENLQKFLPAILDQKYTDFEVILINDAS